MNFSSIPFSYHWIIRRVIGQPKTILDLGCGEGDFSASLFGKNNFQITGVEIYPGSLKKAQKTGIYKKMIKSDIVKLPAGLKSGYDVVFVSQAIEHLPKKKGLKALRVWEKKGRKVVVTTPVGFVPFHQLERPLQDQNPYQKHLSGWEVSEFRNLGYRVYGQGLGFLYRSSLVKQLPPFCFPILNLISFLFSPFVYWIPELGMYQIAVKEIKNEK